MYLLLGILLLICILFFLLLHYHKKKIICKLNGMNTCQKTHMLNQILEPFGFSYVPSQDIITSRHDAWQRQFGYCSLYDKTAPHFNMVFDCEPIYFHYAGRTWLIEVWKGQYGINIGCEVGIYYTEGLLPPEQYDRTLFHSVPDEQMLPISLALYHKGSFLFELSRPHWWLTGFCTGKYCAPKNLVMDVSITCPNIEMLHSFTENLLHTGYPRPEINICELTVSFSFSITHTKQPHLCKCLTILWAQWINRLLCRLFQWITGPFHCVPDKILYLYFFLPFAARHMLCLKRNRKQKFRRKGKCHHEL